VGYTSRSYVNVTAQDKRRVRVLRRLALKRELRGERMRRQATRATKRGWYYD
jgi:hypothetical protein